MSRSVRVSVPATSANLGPGFDALGLALGWYDVVEAELAENGLDVRVTGAGAGEVPLDGDHLVVRAMRGTFASLGVEVAGLRLACTNSIPHGRGLGSSAAAIVAGVLAARALAGAVDDVDAALALAAKIEGHPDNVAPCLLGGLTIAWSPSGRVRAVALDVHPDVRPVVCVPAESLSTETARGLLPASVPHAAAARNAGRAALLVEALTRRPDLLLDATEDELHQPYRAPAMPDTLTLMKDLRERGIAAVVSGAGPSVLALTIGDQYVAKVPGWEVRALPVDRRGAGTTRSDGADGHDTVAYGNQG
ncbi:MAG TPA: homoserine kinase [Jiangellaceae bacterium]|nr:homoserine kinase [Jiangellaceae bacterium]